MSKNNNPYSKPSAEEIELWWKEGMKGENFRRLYNARIAKREAWNTRNGVVTTYYDEESNLPDLVVTAPKETEELKQARLNKDLENFVDNAITVAGFVPGVDTFADIADIGNSLRRGDYSGMLWGLAGLGLPVSGRALKSGWDLLKNAQNYYKTKKVAKALDKSISFAIKAESRAVKHAKERGLNPLNYKILGKTVGLPEKDPKTFYHYGRVPIKDGKLIPLPGFDGQEGRIWWNLGVVPRYGDWVIATKSKLVDENVLKHPEKYSPYRGFYKPSYYTSGAIPVDEVEIYNRNPFTNLYERGIFHMPSVQKIESELLSMENLNFADGLISNWRNKISLNNKVKK